MLAIETCQVTQHVQPLLAIRLPCCADQCGLQCMMCCVFVVQAIRTIIETEPNARGANELIYNASYMMNQIRQVALRVAKSNDVMHCCVGHRPVSKTMQLVYHRDSRGYQNTFPMAH